MSSEDEVIIPEVQPGWVDTGFVTDEYKAKLQALGTQLTSEPDLWIDYCLGNLEPIMALARRFGLKINQDNLAAIINEALGPISY